MKEIFYYYIQLGDHFFVILLECFHFIAITYCSFTSCYICS